jgi:Putative zinc-finger
MSRLQGHPVEAAELLLYADRELPSDATHRLDSHLANCPDCRAELEDLQGGIGTLMQLRKGSASPLPPPRHWESLDARIETWNSRWRIGLLLDRLPEFSKLRYRLAAMVAVLAVALIVSILQPWQRIVSANELLVRAMAAQTKSLTIAQGQVIHEKFQIRRKAALPAGEMTVNYESWREESVNRFLQNSSSADIVADLQRIYQANGLDWELPLSADAFAKWRAALTEKRDLVADSDSGHLILTTLVHGRGKGDVITKAQLVVRADDWRPIVARLWLRDREYEIAEVGFEVLSSIPFEPALFQSRVDSLFPIAAPRLRRSERTPSASAAKQGLLKRDTSLVGHDTTSVSISRGVIGAAISDNVGVGNVTSASEAATKMQRASIATTASLPSAPVPQTPPSFALTFQAHQPQQSIVGLQLQHSLRVPTVPPVANRPQPMPTAPTRFPLPNGVLPQHRPPQVDPLRALATKLGIVKKKKSVPIESAPPGG